jgi:hypothetical protein
MLSLQKPLHPDCQKAHSKACACVAGAFLMRDGAVCAGRGEGAGLFRHAGCGVNDA